MPIQIRSAPGHITRFPCRHRCNVASGVGQRCRNVGQPTKKYIRRTACCQSLFLGENSPIALMICYHPAPDWSSVTSALSDSKPSKRLLAFPYASYPVIEGEGEARSYLMRPNSIDSHPSYLPPPPSARYNTPIVTQPSLFSSPHSLPQRYP